MKMCFFPISVSKCYAAFKAAFLVVGQLRGYGGGGTTKQKIWEGY